MHTRDDIPVGVKYARNLSVDGGCRDDQNDRDRHREKNQPNRVAVHRVKLLSVLDCVKAERGVTHFVGAAFFVSADAPMDGRRGLDEKR